MKRKDQSIETLRGLAIILMVSGHVIGVNQTRGLMVGDDTAWRYLFYATKYIQMELFAAISGYVYAIKPFRGTKFGRFILAKSRRLLVPLVIVSTIQFLYRVIIPYSHNPYLLKNIWKIYFFTYGHFWFIQVLFLVFIAIFVLEYFRLLNNVKTWAIIYITVTVIFAGWNPLLGITLFSLTRFLFILSFFLLGIGIKRFLNDGQISDRFILLSGIILIVSYTFYFYSLFYDIRPGITFFRIIGTFIGISSTIVLFRYRTTNKLLARLGFYSYGIYLLHLFGVRFILEASRYLDIHIHLITFIFALTVGLGLPVLFEIGIMKNNTLRFLFLGMKPVNNSRGKGNKKSIIFVKKLFARDKTKYA